MPRPGPRSHTSTVRIDSPHGEQFPLLPGQLRFTACSPLCLVVVHPYGNVTQRPNMRKTLVLGHRGLGGRDSPVGNPVARTRSTRGVGSSAGQVGLPAWLPSAPAPGSSRVSWRRGAVRFGRTPTASRTQARRTCHGRDAPSAPKEPGDGRGEVLPQAGGGQHPRSPARQTRESPKCSFSFSTCEATVFGSPVLPSKTSMATGMPSLVVSGP